MQSTSQDSLEVRIFETSKNIIKAVMEDPRDTIILDVSGFASNPIYRGRKLRDPVSKARSRVCSLVSETVGGEFSWIDDSRVEIHPTIKRAVSLPVPALVEKPFRTQSAPHIQPRPAPSKGFIPVHRQTPRR